MSNHLAIAAVTATLRHVIHEALAAPGPGPVGGADVTTYRPEQLADTDLVGATASGVNVYLYQVTPNHALNLSDLPTHRGDGSLARRPVAALDLHYLLTAYGDDSALEPDRLLGRTVLALTETPVFTTSVINAAVAKYGHDATAFLHDADLWEQRDLVKVSPIPLTLEEMGRLWSALGLPYRLSVCYALTVVLLESAKTPRRALPVLQPVLDVRPQARPVLTAVEVHGGGPALAGSTLVLHGSGLLSAHTRVDLAGHQLIPEPASQPHRLSCVIPASVPAGVHAVRVVHRGVAPARTGAHPIEGESAARPLMVVPRVQAALSGTGPDDPIEVTVTPGVHPGQRASLWFSRLPAPGPLGPTDGPADGAASDVVAVSFPPVAAGTAPVTTLSVPRDRVSPGTWLVRVDVDGVENVPTLVGGTFQEPAVTIP